VLRASATHVSGGLSTQLTPRATFVHVRDTGRSAGAGAARTKPAGRTEADDQPVTIGVPTLWKWLVPRPAAVTVLLNQMPYVLSWIRLCAMVMCVVTAE